MAGENAEDAPGSGEGGFITKGMQVTIPNLTLRVGPNGEIEADPVVLHVGLDLCPYWLGIALDHLDDTQKANVQVRQAHADGNNEEKAAGLNAEFTAGMQAIVASGIAIDAFYTAVKDHIDIPPDLIRTWRSKGTARYKQIGEVLRRAFPLSQESAKSLREVLKQNLSFRDVAVHPPAGTAAPAWHPELEQPTEWRFMTFRLYNAKAIVGLTLSVVAQLANRPHQDKYESLRKHCESLISSVSPLVARWESQFGPLYERSTKA